jgi:NADPH-dependent 7-cyano-7-deazaguanine reductase QueF
VDRENNVKDYPAAAVYPRLKTQPNEGRCDFMDIRNVLSLPPCCPISGNPQNGSTITIAYTSGPFLLEVYALKEYIESYRGGRGDVRSMEGMIQEIAKDCAESLSVDVVVTAHLDLAPEQKMIVVCSAYAKQTKPEEKTEPKKP